MVFFRSQYFFVEIVKADPDEHIDQVNKGHGKNVHDPITDNARLEQKAIPVAHQNVEQTHPRRSRQQRSRAVQPPHRVDDADEKVEFQFHFQRPNDAVDARQPEPVSQQRPLFQIVNDRIRIFQSQILRERKNTQHGQGEAHQIQRVDPEHPGDKKADAVLFFQGEGDHEPADQKEQRNAEAPQIQVHSGTRSAYAFQPERGIVQFSCHPGKRHGERIVRRPEFKRQVIYHYYHRRSSPQCL